MQTLQLIESIATKSHGTAFICTMNDKFAIVFNGYEIKIFDTAEQAKEYGRSVL